VNFNINLSQKLNYYETYVSNIWRNGPDCKEQANMIYKFKNEDNRYYLDNIKIKEKGTYYSFENRFPILPLNSISYFSTKEIKEIKFSKLYNKFMKIETETEEEFIDENEKEIEANNNKILKENENENNEEYIEINFIEGE
jgi:hypothetical protein